MNFWQRIKALFGWAPAPPVVIEPPSPPPPPPPPVDPPPPPKPVYDVQAESYGPEVETGYLFGFNCARAFKTSLKANGDYWYDVDLDVIGAENFNVLRNGGTVTMGQRFDFAYKGNGYAKSVGTWPAIYRQEKRIGTPPSLSEFVSDAELKMDAKEPDNYHVNLKEALSATGAKMLYVANPFQDAAELRAVIQYFGPEKFVGIVAGNELNSPKAFRYGIRAEDVAYWAGTLRPVCEEYGIQLGVGLPPYEYRDKELKGEALNGKLAADKVFAETIALHKQLFDFVCIHPYGQVPERKPEDDLNTWLQVAAASMPKDYDFVKVQVDFYYNLVNLPLYLDEHGLEKPEFGHCGTAFASRWHFERAMAMINLSLEYPIMGSCWQILLAENPGIPQSLVYDAGGYFEIGSELWALFRIKNLPTRKVTLHTEREGLTYAINGNRLLFINDSDNFYTVGSYSVTAADLWPVEKRTFVYAAQSTIPARSYGVVHEF